MSLRLSVSRFSVVVARFYYYYYTDFSSSFYFSIHGAQAPQQLLLPDPARFSLVALFFFVFPSQRPPGKVTRAIARRRPRATIKPSKTPWQGCPVQVTCSARTSRCPGPQRCAVAEVPRNARGVSNSRQLVSRVPPSLPYLPPRRLASGSGIILSVRHPPTSDRGVAPLFPR